MTITIPDEIERAAVEMSNRSGSTADRVILSALQAYFLPIPSALQDEFDAWELASDNDMAALEVDLKIDVVEPK